MHVAPRCAPVLDEGHCAPFHCSPIKPRSSAKLQWQGPGRKLQWPGTVNAGPRARRPTAGSRAGQRRESRDQSLRHGAPASPSRGPEYREPFSVLLSAFARLATDLGACPGVAVLTRCLVEQSICKLPTSLQFAASPFRAAGPVRLGGKCVAHAGPSGVRAGFIRARKIPIALRTSLKTQRGDKVPRARRVDPPLFMCYLALLT